MEYIKTKFKEDVIMSIKHDLVEEFNSELEELGKMEVGGEKYKVAVDGIAKLADRIIEIDKIETESNDKFESQNIENELKALRLYLRLKHKEHFLLKYFLIWVYTI